MLHEISYDIRSHVDGIWLFCDIPLNYVTNRIIFMYSFQQHIKLL